MCGFIAKCRQLFVSLPLNIYVLRGVFYEKNRFNMYARSAIGCNGTKTVFPAYR